jgi:hypothetical protein
MADKNILEQMLEHLVNDDQAKAEELFHEYVVGKSREIYEQLIESELKDEEVDESADDEEIDESSDDEEVDESADDEELDENLGEFAPDAGMGDMMGGDETDDLESELGDEGDDEEDMGEKEPDELFQDLASIVDELQAKFDSMNGDEMGDDEMGDDEVEVDDEEEMVDSFEPELKTVREYVEKVADGHGAEKKGKAETADSKKSIIDNMKNDMGGTTANILSGRNGADSVESGAAGGKLKGTPLSDQNAKEDNAGNINVPGGKAGKTGFTHKEPGHGAEKKGTGESPDNKQSIFRGRR